MIIYFSCPSCAEIMEAPSTLSGFTIVCPACEGTRIKIPMVSLVDLPNIRKIDMDDVLPQPKRVFDVFSPAPFNSLRKTIETSDHPITGDQWKEN